MRLYLIRHAATVPGDPARWPDDGVRPLTPAGMEEFREAAAGLARIAGSVDAVLASPFVRTRQTAEILAICAGWARATEAPQLVPGRTAGQALALVREHELRASGPGGESRQDHGEQGLALVGHEPNLLELISLCLAGDDARVRCDIEKGGAACLLFPATVSAGDARLEWLLTPRALRALAR
ncbi:MAG: SixA phosphatase family protein [Steroidobacteraceae bacterium]